MVVSFAEIQDAHQRILPHIYRSPCPHSEALSRLCRAQVFSKLDHLQATGSFKERGACNRLLQLDPEQRRRGVIAVSAGNHALGLARHAAALQIPVTVVMPRYAPLIKVDNCKLLGAHVILHGDCFDEAKDYALALSEEEGLLFIPAFDDPHIIAGQGTIALEILEDVPDLAAVFIPVGGGGLIAGMAQVIKTLRPDCRVIGVEPLYAPCMSEALKAGRPLRIQGQPTLADGLAVAEVGQHCFDTCHHLIDEIVLVSESAIAQAIVRLLEHEKTVLEGAGAAALAGALAAGVIERHGLQGAAIALTLCGGNIDLSKLNRVIQRAFASDGRMCRISCSIKDQPGGILQVLQIIADQGGNVTDLGHDRHFAALDPALVTSIIAIETRDHAHIAEIHAALHAAGIDFQEG